MTKKIFYTDLDGTLLTDGDKRVSPLTWQALDRFTAAGNHFVICTGRPTMDVHRILDEQDLHFPGMYVITYNGAEIYDPASRKVLLRFGVEKSLALNILELCEKRGIHVHTFQDPYVVTRRYNEAVEYYLRYVHSPVIVAEDILAELKQDPGKLIAIELHEHDRIEALRQELVSLYGDRMTFLFSNDKYLEMFSNDAGKGKALVKLAEYLDIPIADTMAAGDQENDLSMIEAAGLGIAMCNGSERVRNAADVVTTDDNNHDGLIPFLRT